MGPTLQRHPFSGLVDSAARALTLHLPDGAGETGRWCALRSEASGSHLGRRAPALTFIAPRGFRRQPLTRARVRLLGPCFKTGRGGGRRRRDPVRRRGPIPPGGATRSGALRTVRPGRQSRRGGGPAPRARPAPARRPPRGGGGGRRGAGRGGAAAVFSLGPGCGELLPAGSNPAARRGGGPPARRGLPSRPGAGRGAPLRRKCARRGPEPSGRRSLRNPLPRGGGRRTRRPGPADLARRVESSGRTARTPPVYLLTVSRPLELSLQSSFQLSLTVLVDYRSRAGICIDGVYHPLWAAFPSNPTPKTRSRRAGGRHRPHTVRGLCLDQKDLGPPPERRRGVGLPYATFPAPHRGTGIRRWALPSSLAVTEGILGGSRGPPPARSDRPAAPSEGGAAPRRDHPGRRPLHREGPRGNVRTRAAAGRRAGTHHARARACDGNTADSRAERAPDRTDRPAAHLACDAGADSGDGARRAAPGPSAASRRGRAAATGERARASRTGATHAGGTDDLPPRSAATGAGRGRRRYGTDAVGVWTWGRRPEAREPQPRRGASPPAGDSDADPAPRRRRPEPGRRRGTGRSARPGTPPLGRPHRRWGGNAESRGGAPRSPASPGEAARGFEPPPTPGGERRLGYPAHVFGEGNWRRGKRPTLRRGDRDAAGPASAGGAPAAHGRGRRSWKTARRQPASPAHRACGSFLRSVRRTRGEGGAGPVRRVRHSVTKAEGRKDERTKRDRATRSAAGRRPRRRGPRSGWRGGSRRGDPVEPRPGSSGHGPANDGGGSPGRGAGGRASPPPRTAQRRPARRPGPPGRPGPRPPLPVRGRRGTHRHRLGRRATPPPGPARAAVSALQPYSPEPKDFGFRKLPAAHGNNAAGSLVGIVYGRNYDGPRKSPVLLFSSLPPASGVGNLRLLPSLDVVAVSQAPSPESNPDSPLPVVTMDQPGSRPSCAGIGAGEGAGRRRREPNAGVGRLGGPSASRRGRSGGTRAAVGPGGGSPTEASRTGLPEASLGSVGSESR
ncbi:collagen alpha-1(I) chain-like [Ahaetulla prasina]|uniref:collagen alpha-1(I) chain-like n=1 Tax=Ahaetulla prasina TaxID=499056 RepID=UPI0026472A4B|nr:collagen alpha-1(I) chain-like [Ahaetulla prasina]